MMKLSSAVVICLALTIGATLVAGDGKLTYGDKCSVSNAILQVFTNSDSNENEKCNLNQGLICTGTCTCPPTRVWETGPLWGILGGSGCIVAANGPCTTGDKCVTNAVCGDNLPLCFCNEGYYAHDSRCVSGSGHNSSSRTTSVTWGHLSALLASFVFLWQF